MNNNNNKNKYEYVFFFFYMDPGINFRCKNNLEVILFCKICLALSQYITLDLDYKHLYTSIDHFN